MAGRVADKVAIVVGGGQTPGETIGNGRATAILLGREGARVTVADRNLASAEETTQMIKSENGEATALQVDATDEEALHRLVEATVERYGKLDILHNNVGAGLALGDASAEVLSEATFDRIVAVNFKSAWLASKHALPHLRKGGGSIVNISSMAAKHEYPWLGYKVTKTALLALTEHLAAAEAKYRVRVNAIMPGAMNTPMAVEPRVQRALREGSSREEVIAARDKRVPLGGKMGSGWDVGYAALFFHSDEARFISGVALPVDGAEWVSLGSQGT